MRGAGRAPPHWAAGVVWAPASPPCETRECPALGCQVRPYQASCAAKRRLVKCVTTRRNGAHKNSYTRWCGAARRGVACAWRVVRCVVVVGGVREVQSKLVS